MEKLYRLVFKGELLAGQDPAEIRQRAARRLGASPSQLARLFSGQPVTLKRGLALEAAARYAVELRQLGMRMHIELDGSAPAPIASTDTRSYRVVFAGQLLPGFVREAVMQAAASRLNASSTQLAALFSGRKTVLKKGLDAAAAERYIRRLRDLGMLAAAEPQSPVAAPSVPQAPPPAVRESHVETLVQMPLMRAVELPDLTSTQVDMDFSQTMVDNELSDTNAQPLPDMEKTELAGPAALRAYLHDSQHAPEPAPAGPSLDLRPTPDEAGTRVASASARPVPPALTGSAHEGTLINPPRHCSACGARQSHGRFCVHCGQEFPRELPREVPREQAATPLVQPLRSTPAPEPVETLPRRARRNTLPIAAALGCLGLMIWWLLP